MYTVCSTCTCILYFLPAEELQNISTKFAVGFGSFVDKVAYPYASTLQNGSDYMKNDLTDGYVNIYTVQCHTCTSCYTVKIYTCTCTCICEHCCIDYT